MEEVCYSVVTPINTKSEDQLTKGVAYQKSGSFSNFKRWMERQDFEGMHLDKDLLFEGV